MKRLIPVGLTVLLAIASAFLFKSAVRDVLVVPLLYVYWLAQLYLRSVPQMLIWGAFIFVALIVIVRPWMANRSRERTTRSQTGDEQLGPLEALAESIRLSRRGGYSRRRLARRLSEIAVEILSLNQRVQPGEAKASLKRGEWEAPPDVAALLQEGLVGQIAPLGPSWLQRLLRELRDPRGFSSESDPELERAVETLEQELGEGVGREGGRQIGH